MDKRNYSRLKWIAALMVAAWVVWSLYDWLIAERQPHGQRFDAAARFLEDGQFQHALGEYDAILSQDPDNIFALRGRSQALLQLGEHEQALVAYSAAISRDEATGIDEQNRSSIAVLYAQRGILKDRMGDYDGAISDYERAIALEPETTEGPSWLTRFLRNQPERPPTITDRARYLREQLAKPEAERLLRLPEKDDTQRPYKM